MLHGDEAYRASSRKNMRPHSSKLWATCFLLLLHRDEGIGLKPEEDKPPDARVEQRSKDVGTPNIVQNPAPRQLTKRRQNYADDQLRQVFIDDQKWMRVVTKPAFKDS